MSYLLDTHIVLWLANNPNKLSKLVRNILEDSELKIYFSAVNLWEIAIKNQLDRNDFHVDTMKLYHQLVAHEFIELPVLAKHILSLENLERHHKDPFDRILIAQAISEGLILITHDSAIWKYTEVKLIKA